jgi:hypothetical protein
MFEPACKENRVRGVRVRLAYMNGAEFRILVFNRAHKFPAADVIIAFDLGAVM